MDMIETDILVAGGGIAGLAAVARFAADGLDAVCVDPRPAGEESDDLRTTAFLQPSVDTLARAGAWEGMAPGAVALWTMRLVDAGGRVRQPRERCDFRSREVAEGPFGYNVDNRSARRALVARVAEMPRARLMDGARVEHVTRRTRDAVATLSDGRRVRARLVVAADGRDSRVRTDAGLTARRWSYGQKALVFAVAHGPIEPGVSTEIHSTGGPLTLVPMPERDGRPVSSVVWMMPAERADRLMAADDAALGAEVTADTMGLFGPLEPVGPRQAWPIVSQIATRLTAERLALVAEAAHVIPPIGAQGLNMSLADVETLARLVAGAAREGRDIGEERVLSAYARARHAEVAARVAGVDVLNRLAQAEFQPVRDLRRIGLRALHEIGPVRHMAMRLGLGARRGT